MQRKASAPARPAPARGAAPRGGGVIQRLHLTQAGRVIAEDNDTLKAEYNLAKTQGRWVDWQAIMDAQNAIPRVEIPAIISMGPPTVVAEPEVVAEPVAAAAAAAAASAPAPLPAGVVLKSKLPKRGGTAGQRYINHSKDGRTHTSISFKNRDATTVTVTGMHVTFSDGSHVFWNSQSPAGTFYLSSMGGGRIASIAKTSSLEKAWTWIERDARKVNCTAIEPTWT